MSTKLSAIICNLCVSIFLIMSTSVAAEQRIQFIETTGRAVITDDESIDKARRNSLEDAIFLAAIHGGAKINGFSSIDKETTLTVHTRNSSILLLIEIFLISVLDEMSHLRVSSDRNSSLACSTSLRRSDDHCEAVSLAEAKASSQS